jgi:hypothetical protein
VSGREAERVAELSDEIVLEAWHRSCRQLKDQLENDPIHGAELALTLTTATLLADKRGIVAEDTIINGMPHVSSRVLTLLLVGAAQ